ncbi:hypothetical protein HGRIS_007108 [Hohenbuehelia grisea]|uniref:DUF6534 domain-containing protein n=1 Tax=Hohenbuehelia grisea TaxID=104357 RepID=A0ABR3JB65_9AGAR
MSGGIATGVKVALGREFTVLMGNKPSAVTWLMSSVAADILITGSLLSFLHRHKTGVPRTDDLISKIIRMTLQTGLITSICAILDVTLILTELDTTMFALFDFCVAKLYTNALLSTLNARPRWNKILNGNMGPNVLFWDEQDAAFVDGPGASVDLHRSSLLDKIAIPTGSQSNDLPLPEEARHREAGGSCVERSNSFQL